MADLLQNFAYCALTADTTNSATTLAVDECSRLPSNASLSASSFWMTFESTYAAGAFEIVQVTAKSATSGPGNLTVVRAQEGTTGAIHLTGTYLKSTLTAAIAGRLAPVRATVTATTSSLAPNATDGTTTITIAKAFCLYSIATSRPARVRLYSTAAQLTADASRAIGTDPAGSAGVLLDYVTVAGSTVYSLSPLVEGANLESSPTTAISMSVTNLDVSTGTVVVTLVAIRTE